MLRPGLVRLDSFTLRPGLVRLFCLRLWLGGDPQWRAYAALIARIVSDDRYYREVRDLYDPVALEYMEAFETLYPNAAKKDLATLLTLTVSSLLSIVASRERISGLSHEEIPSTPLDYRTVLVDFCAGGIERALAGG